VDADSTNAVIATAAYVIGTRSDRRATSDNVGLRVQTTSSPKYSKPGAPAGRVNLASIWYPLFGT
jgi:hypothetical protein